VPASRASGLKHASGAEARLLVVTTAGSLWCVPCAEDSQRLPAHNSTGRGAKRPLEDASSSPQLATDTGAGAGTRAESLGTESGDEDELDIFKPMEFDSEGLHDFNPSNVDTEGITLASSFAVCGLRVRSPIVYSCPSDKKLLTLLGSFILTSNHDYHGVKDIDASCFYFLRFLLSDGHLKPFLLIITRSHS
jgi:hypothetical protein